MSELITPLTFCLYYQDLANMDVDDIMQKQVEQLEKEKKELQERLRNQEKKVSLSVYVIVTGWLYVCLSGCCSVSVCLSL